MSSLCTKPCSVKRNFNGARHALPSLTQYYLAYDMIREFNGDWQVGCGQLDLAHVTKNIKCIKKKKLSSDKKCPESPVRVQDPWRHNLIGQNHKNTTWYRNPAFFARKRHNNHAYMAYILQLQQVYELPYFRLHYRPDAFKTSHIIVYHCLCSMSIISSCSLCARALLFVV